MSIPRVGPHGTISERRGCKCDWCHAVANLRKERTKVRRARGDLDVIWVPVDEPRRQLKAIMRAGWTQGRIGKELGTTQQDVSYVLKRQQRVTVKRAQKIAALYRDVCGEVSTDARLFPAEPLIEAVVKRYGSVKASGNAEARRLHEFQKKGVLTAAQADKWARRLVESHPAELWDDWYEAS